MLGKMGPCLREHFNFYLSNFNRRPAQLWQIRDLFNQAVENNTGLAVSEDWHGVYAYPLFMQSMMKDMADRGVKKLYAEFIPASRQNLIDQWQDHGDDSQITRYFDMQFMGYSKRMWQHYWMLMQESHAHGIRVIGVDNPEICSGYGAAFDAPFKTMHWEGIIYKDRLKLNTDEKFVVYGGALHATDGGGALKGIHQHLNIPRIMLEYGDYSIAKLPFDKNLSAKVRIPPVIYQDEPHFERDVRNVMVNSPL